MSCLEKSGLDYELWRVGASRCEFRGPRADVERPLITVLGGSEAFGRFVPAPFSTLLGKQLEAEVVNLSVMHAGLTLLRTDPDILDIASRAETVVLQVLGAQNMTNPFYTVHPRRNDRFIAASPRLQTLYPQVDFTGFNFTGHLLQTLETIDPWAFDTLIETLRATWVENMSAVLGRLPENTLLLWMSTRSPDNPARGSAAREPVFVDRALLSALDGAHAGLVEVSASREAAQEGIDSMWFEPEEENAARLLPGPIFHAEVADALSLAIPSGKEKRRAGNADAPPLDSTGLRASR